MKKAIIVGASSGIGEALAKVFAKNNFEVGLVSRRIELLKNIGESLGVKYYVKQIDLNNHQQSRSQLLELIEEMKSVDIIVVNSGVWIANPDLELEKELDTISVNVCGFVSIINSAVSYFLSRNSGHIVGMSSIAGLRGSGRSPSYNASKAFVSNYLEGIRQKLFDTNIFVTDIRPGLVDTPMIKGRAVYFWTASPDTAASQIFEAIRKRKKIAYVTKRWRIVSWVLKLIPERLYHYIYRARIINCQKIPS